MASILNVDTINNAAGTSAISINSGSGLVTFPNSVTIPDGAGMPAGSVLQTQIQNITAVTNITSGTFTDVGTVNITPNYSNSKILVFAIGGSIYIGAGGASLYASMRLAKNGSSFGNQNTVYHAEIGRNLSVGTHVSYSMCLIDSNVGTTSSVAYSMQARVDSGSGGLGFNDTQGTSIIYAMEIAQ